MAARDRKIIKYRQPIKINIGIIIFLILFLYMCFSVYTYLSRDKVSFYEVKEGSMARNTQHTGIILREEAVQYSEHTGYVSFFTGSGKRVSVGTEVYSLDETGAMTEYLKSSSTGSGSLSDENVHKIRKELSAFSSSCRDDAFYQVYDAKTSLNSALLEYASGDMAENLEEAMAASGISYSRVYAPYTGVVSFDIDGFEERTPDSLVAEDFDKSGYSVVHLRSGQLVENRRPVYKIVTSEVWNIVFPLAEGEKEEYADLSYMKVALKGSGIEAAGAYEQYTGKDGNPYGRLTFDKYAADFVDERFISFDIEGREQTGLKIPKSAVVQKAFYVIPRAYYTEDAEGNGGFYKEIYTEEGTKLQFAVPGIYASDDTQFLIDVNDTSPIRVGDFVTMPDGSERYKISSTVMLDGVYNINKGYTVFRQIDVLDSNDEYYTVRKNQKYGLSVYDHILFDPTGFSEGDFIYN